jgi:hypothetical protein
VAIHANLATVKFGNSQHVWDKPAKLFERARSVAEGEEARRLIGENIQIARENLKLAEDNKDYLKCWFCKMRPPEKGCEATVDIHGNVTREFAGYNKTRYKWETRTLAVPRCARCREVHKKADGWGNAGALLGLGGGALVVLFLIAQQPKDWAGVGCGGLLATALAAGLLSVILKGIGVAISPSDVKREAIKVDFPSVVEWKKKGWELGAKPANVN